MKQKRVFLMCGVPGSGKSTWVRERIAKYGGYHVSRDEIRFNLLDRYGGDYFSYEDEVINTFYKNINEILDNDEQCVDIYVDATHLTKTARMNVLRKIHKEKAYLIAVWFDTPLELCLYRNKLRTGKAVVPDKTIEEMYNRARKPSIYDFDEVWTINADGDKVLEEGSLI